MTIRDSIESKLANALSPIKLRVIDESHMHAGHQPDITGTGETHMRVQIITEFFSGKTRVARHREINALLQDELDAGLHALAIEAAAPGEKSRLEL